MRRNPVKAALKAGQPQVGTWLSLGDVFAARLMARIGDPAMRGAAAIDLILPPQFKMGGSCSRLGEA